MTAAAPREDRLGVLPWGACLLAAAALHGAAAWFVLTHVALPSAPVPPPVTVLLDLPPLPADTVPAPEPQPAAAIPESPPPLLPPAVMEPALAPPRAVAPPPVPRPRRAHPVEQRPAVAAPPPAAPAAAPAAAVAQPPSNAVPSWRGELVARLQQAKRYPLAARSRGDQGVALVTFTMDRAGHVLSASLVRSSGSADLDEEAVAMIRRADPLPAMPADLPGGSITLTVPVNFSLH